MTSGASLSGAVQSNWSLRLLHLARSFLREYSFPLAVFAGLRAWTLVWASAVAAFGGVSAEASRHYYGLEPLRDALIAPWQRWDTIWYSKIALEGYLSDVRVVFPPLYPLLLRILTPLVGNNVVATGLIVSSGAALVCFVLLYRLARDLEGAEHARRAVLFLAAFPTAFYLFAAYSEALFLALILGAFVCARRERWGWAGVLGGLAAMTRAQGIFLLLPFAVEFWMQQRAGRVAWRQAWVLGLIAAGSAAHMLWLVWQFSSPQVWFDAQAVWHRTVLPWQAAGEVWRAIFAAPSALEAALSTIQACMALVLLGALVWSARRLPPAYTAYLAVIALPSLFLVNTYSSQYPLTDVARYALTAFPLFLLLGAAPGRRWQAPVLGIFFFLQCVWLMLFVLWVFVH